MLEEKIISIFITDLQYCGIPGAVLVVMNFFMKASIFVPLKNLPTAPQTAHLLLQYVFDCYGLPDHGVTDSGAQFTT